MAHFCIGWSIPAAKTQVLVINFFVVVGRFLLVFVQIQRKLRN